MSWYIPVDTGFLCNEATMLVQQEGCCTD